MSNDYRILGMLKPGELVSLLAILGMVAGGAIAYSDLKGKVEDLTNKHAGTPAVEHPAVRADSQPGLSQTDIAEAVRRYVQENEDDLRGPNGPAGAPGQDGRDGDELTPHQLEKAILHFTQQYEGSLRGLAGPKGDRGQVGPQGPAGNVPVGTILAWHKTPTGRTTPPNGWVECNGPLTRDNQATEFDETKIPDLNGGRKEPNEGWDTERPYGVPLFLRGGLTSGEFEHDTYKKHRHGLGNNASFIGKAKGGDRTISKGPGASKIIDSQHDNHAGEDETRPKNMSVVWIIRVK